MIPKNKYALAILLLISAFVFFGRGAPTAFATYTITPITPVGITGFTLDFSNITGFICPTGNSGTNIWIKIYNGSYPDTSSVKNSPLYGNCYNNTWTWETQFNTARPYDITNSGSVSYPDGNYWISFYSQTDPSYYYNFSVIGGTLLSSIGNTPNSITTSTPVNGSTGVDGYINFFGVYSNDGTYDTIDILLTDNTLNTSVSFTCALPIIGTSTFACGHLGKISTSYSSLTMLRHSNETFPGGTYEPDSLGTINFTTGITTTVPITLQEQTCGSLDLACMAKNFIIWAFTASPTSLNNFGLLKDSLITKFPFSYIADIGVLWADAFNVSSNTFSISIQFLGHTFNLISTTQLNAISFEPLVKTIMSAIAMFFTAMFIYKKVIKIHDQGHQTV